MARIRRCLLYGWDVGHESRAGGWRARFACHALEAACCMGEMWAMRAELEDEGPGLHDTHYKVLVVWVRCGPWGQSWRMKGQVYMTCIRRALLVVWVRCGPWGQSWRMKGQVYMTWCIISCLLYGWDVGHESRAVGWRARFTWHALEAACCMGEMWAMRAGLEDEGPGLYDMH